MTNKRVIFATVVAVGVVLLAVGFALSKRVDEPPSWKSAFEGFLGVATPCCTEATLWPTLDTVTDDGQRARPASAAEAAQWLNRWPYRARDADDEPEQVALSVAAQSSEVRCVGAATGPEVPRNGDDEETLEAIRRRPECTYAKWKVWNAHVAEEHPNERHTVWLDQEGFFHGRVDYWK